VSVETRVLDALAASLDIAETAASAGVYEYVGEVFFYDDRVSKDMVRTIREAWPNYVPVRCRKIYKSPVGAEETVDYYVIGSYVEHPSEEYKDDNLQFQTTPTEIPVAWRNKVQALRILQGEWPKGSVPWRLCAPEPPLPFGHQIVEQMQMARKFFDPGIKIEGDEVRPHEFMADKLAQIIAAISRQDDEDVRRGNEEAAYRVRHDWAQYRKAIENERWVPEPPSPKPFVDLNLRGR